MSYENSVLTVSCDGEFSTSRILLEAKKKLQLLIPVQVISSLLLILIRSSQGNQSEENQVGD